MVDQTAVKVGLSIFCCVWIVAVSLFGASYDTVDPLEVGIKFDGNVQKIDLENLYGQGRYFVGLGQSFITFPRIVQDIKFGPFEEATANSVKCRSREGMAVTLDITFQYKFILDQNHLIKFWLDWGEDPDLWYVPFYKSSRAVIRDTCSEFLSVDFISFREKVALKMHKDLHSYFTEFLHADLVGFQLVNMEFDALNVFAKAIEGTEIARQQIEKKIYERDEKEVQAQQLIEVATLESQVKVISAEAEAFEQVLSATAQANALIDKIKTEIEGLKKIKQELGLNNDQLIDYLWSITARETKSTTVSLNLDVPSILN